MLIEILLIGAVCLAGAAAERYLVIRRPLGRWSAAMIAVASSAILSFIHFHIALNAGDLAPKVSPFWWLFAFPAYRILRRDRVKSGLNFLQDAFFFQKVGGTDEETPPATEKQTALSRSEMMAKLREMAADPETTAEKRAWAEDRLAKFERIDQGLP